MLYAYLCSVNINIQDNGYEIIIKEILDFYPVYTVYDGFM